MRVVEHLWIPVGHGVRLAARAWLPDAPGERARGPAVLEYLPYRKRDGTRRRDETIHPVLAAHGHPCFRVDVRGTGESDGLLSDEYAETEIEDGLAVLSWIARQPGSGGRAVVLGKSWGGINALMIAARRPPELAGVVSVCATNDRYANDAHYMGGRLLAENLTWGVGLMAVAAHPPDPRLYGDAWREAWRARLAAVRPFPRDWMAHPTDDGYWRRGRVGDAARDLACPVLLVGGTEDPYRDAIGHLLPGLGAGRVEAVVGPWAHLYPHLGRPGPALDFPMEVVRWLARIDEGASGARPPLLVYVTEGRRERDGGARAGRWVARSGWPSPEATAATFGLGDGTLGDARPGRILLSSPVPTGLAAGGWCRFGLPDEGPYEQSGDDRASVCFDTPPLDRPLDVLGVPGFRATRAGDGGPGLLVARLEEVFEDGRSERVAYGFVDLAHRDRTIEVSLELTAHRFRRESRVRLALASACFPVAWPMPSDGPVTLDRAACALRLPLDDAAGARSLPSGFPAPPPAGLPPEPDLEGFRREVRRDPVTGEVTVHATSDLDASGAPVTHRMEEIDLAHGHGVAETFSVRPGDPASARGEVRHVVRFEVPGLRLDVNATGRVHAEHGRVVFEGELEAFENGQRVARRSW